jgi:hypothetical protein
MKKRILSMLVAAVMAVTMIPAVVAGTQAEIQPQSGSGSHQVRIVARGFLGEADDIFMSDPINVTGTGTFDGTIVFPAGVTEIINLKIVTDIFSLSPDFWNFFDEENFEYAVEDSEAGMWPDPRVPASWSEYVTTVDGIVVNGTENLTSGMVQHFRRRDPGGSDAVIGFALMEMWNAWWAPHNTIEPARRGGVIPWEVTDSPFGLVGGAEFSTMKVEFTVANPGIIDELEPTVGFTNVQLVASANGNFIRGGATRVEGDGVYSVTVSGIGHPLVDELAIISENGDLSTLPFRGKANPAPLAWRADAHILITAMTINGNPRGGDQPTRRWNQVETSPTAVGMNTHFIVDIPLWNAFHAPARILRDVDPVEIEVGDPPYPVWFTIGEPITNITITFRIETVDACTCGTCADCNPPCTCGTCAACNPGCNNCGTCAVCKPDVTVCTCTNWGTCTNHGGRFGFGNVTGGTRPSVTDALQILRTIVRLPSVLNGGVPLPGGATPADALAAANITRAGQPGIDRPQVSDALQILRFIVRLSTHNNWGARYPR